ncbi:MAG TPA: trans-aconitate methyltransferase [Bifidobacterium sp.]|nr:trans-aconitate methyltransferase [Bifidobacterium sp.]
MGRRAPRAANTMDGMTFTWNADQYLKFADQRTQPSRDLCARITLGNDEAHKILDIGCGPGNSTALLRERYPHARIIGIDSSETMVESARVQHPDIEFAVQDATALEKLDDDFDIVFTNACLQWVPDHRTVIPEMLRRVRDGGIAACQFPETIRQRTHTIMRELAVEPPFDQYIGSGGARPYCHLGGDRFDVRAYYDLIAPMAKQVSVWETTYWHALAGYEGVVEWYRGTGMRPYLSQLPTDDLREQYERTFVNRLRAVYPEQRDGTVLLPMRRFFFVAQM